MAILNIKDFPEALYRKLEEQAERNHRSVAQEVIDLLGKATETFEPVSLLDLRGLGKECWKGVDPVEYIRRERDSWDS